MIAQEILDQYEPTIGIECHVQLKTKTKLFSGANNDAREAAPNTTVSPLCFGMPGTLPVLNREALNLAVKAGVALNAQIAEVSSFDRKHYFYPDLPKGYQITQLERPTVGQGKIEVPLGDASFTVRITRAHIEEDAGKLTHPEGADYSLVDLNRAGTPLIEVVSEADMHSPAQAKAYAQELYLLMLYAGVTHGDLYHGNMRFDVNISAAKKGAKEWGTRAEVKNLNSFKSIERAAEYEFRRQVELLEGGEVVVQETRGWHDATQKTFSQRSKADAHDYRYFPDADLPPVVLRPADIDAVRDSMPKLPPELRGELKTLGLKPDAAETLLLADAEARFTEARSYVGTVLAIGQQSRAAAVFAANFLINRDIRYRQDHPTDTASIPAAPEFIAVYQLLESHELSSNTADQLLVELRSQALASESEELKQAIRELAEQRGLLQENNLDALEIIVKEVVSNPANAKAVADIKAGQTKVMGFLVGQIMKQSQGKANPALASQLLSKQLKD